MKTAVVPLLALLMAVPASAQDKSLSGAAFDAAFSYFAGTLVCSELIGDAQISVARLNLEAVLRAVGVTGDSLLIQVDDIEQKLRADQAGRSIMDQAVGGVTTADLALACQQELNEKLHASQVATARLRSAN